MNLNLIANAIHDDRAKHRGHIHSLIGTWTCHVPPSEVHLLQLVQQWMSDVLYGDVEPYWVVHLESFLVAEFSILRQACCFLDRCADRWALRKAARRTPTVACLQPQKDLKDHLAPREYAGRDLVYVEFVGDNAPVKVKWIEGVWQNCFNNAFGAGQQSSQPSPCRKLSECEMLASLPSLDNGTVVSID